MRRCPSFHRISRLGILHSAPSMSRDHPFAGKVEHTSITSALHGTDGSLCSEASSPTAELRCTMSLAC